MTPEGRGDNRKLLLTKHQVQETGKKMMENEKAEIEGLVAKYGKVQSLMRYVNKETLAKSYSR